MKTQTVYYWAGSCRVTDFGAILSRFNLEYFIISSFAVKNEGKTYSSPRGESRNHHVSFHDINLFFYFEEKENYSFPWSRRNFSIPWEIEIVHHIPSMRKTLLEWLNFFLSMKREKKMIISCPEWENTFFSLKKEERLSFLNRRKEPPTPFLNENNVVLFLVEVGNHIVSPLEESKTCLRL